MLQKLIAEFIGTATLAFAVLASLSLANPTLATPVVAGLVLLLFVYSVGSISGAHLNPAVTVGVWSIKKISTRNAVLYILVQCLGGLVAYLAATNVMIGLTVGFTEESSIDFMGELIGMGVFTFGIASVIYGKTAEAVSGIIIGGSLLLGIILAVAVGSAGILNPAVGITLGSVSVSNIAGAVVGSVIGMHMYRYLVR